MAFPKIVWPSGGANTLTFVYPPRNVPYVHYTAVRHDTFSTAGVKQSILERIDTFVNFDMLHVINGADATAWASFMLNSGLLGQAFDYYPDASLPGKTTYTLDDTDFELAYKSLGQFTFKMTMRLYVAP